ncbi:MAG TPA: bifunctional phosphoribosylaminoimidazolecarboxamide formyltransferase/IMP cyclohydrolase [Actinomycetota bacterium]|nr:bifunctional phosphoribosylaminoimidazolecarboxamide formyltransferase/IMP cyclohydrolase [Actinomycetota bacterium]
MADLTSIRTVLVSVSDRSGLAELCSGLIAQGARIIATDSTAKHLSDNGVQATPIADVTGFPEMLDGRVKTLHPRIHGGILANRDEPSHMQQLADHGIDAIDLVVCNLYPFREAVASGKGASDVIEQIDIGGPTLVRAAAKNHGGVGVVVNPERYGSILDEVRNAGGLSADTRQSLAAEAFAMIAAYDAAIAQWMHREREFPERVAIALERSGEMLRYGENPHQRGALYLEQDAPAGSLARARQLHGKELSYNNYLDLDAALWAAFEFSDPACAIIKHAVPCGLATGPEIGVAYARALECDRLSAFGSVVAFNREVTVGAARQLAEIFTECIVAPGFDDGALAILMEKKNLRLLALDGTPRPEPSFRRISGGFLMQDQDVSHEARDTMKVVSKAMPTSEQWNDLDFAWKACRHVRSNAILLARDSATVGIGAEREERIGRRDGALRAVAASDAFFPFRDGLDVVANAGVSAVIQPGGSMRDEEVIAAANDHGIAMVFTGVRHFRHG